MSDIPDPTDPNELWMRERLARIDELQARTASIVAELKENTWKTAAWSFVVGYLLAGLTILIGALVTRII